MLEAKKGIDIVVEIGGITTYDAAVKLFNERLDEVHLSRIEQISHPEVILKIANALQVSPGQLFRFEGMKTALNLDDQITEELLDLIENLKPSTKRKVLQGLKSITKDVRR